MNYPCIDTNVVVRYLVDTPQTIAPRFRGVFDFFGKLEEGAQKVFMPDIVLFQVYFVLTSYYNVPAALAAEKLEGSCNCVEFIQARTGSRGDIGNPSVRKSGYCRRLSAGISRIRGISGVYSFDGDFTARGLALMKVE